MTHPSKRPQTIAAIPQRDRRPRRPRVAGRAEATAAVRAVPTDPSQAQRVGRATCILALALAIAPVAGARGGPPPGADAARSQPAPPGAGATARRPEPVGTSPLPLEIPLPAPGDPAWQPLVFRSIERTSDYEVDRDDAGRLLHRGESRCGASALVLSLADEIDLARTPRLAWRWRLERGLAVTDEHTAAGDDFAARVYVLFRFDPERASAWRRIEQGLGRRLFASEAPGETINYVWASRARRGTSWQSPVRSEVRLVALETDSGSDAPTGWRSAVVDLVADAARLFDPPPRGAPYAIGLMVDADATCQHALAEFADFRLLGPARRAGD